MKFLIALSLLLAVAAAAPAEQKYTTKYDGINLDEILKSDRLFNNYYKCLMDEGRCSPDGKELKARLPDALKTGCSKCSEKQREGTEKVLRYIIDKRKPQWAKLQAKYDPENIYTKKYEDEAAKRNIKV
ncbi:ejaculatory bulb-specific protein 3-like [Culicoides brevitarsis]|uniref:ejaculatory bulb-specific protein 3-like n=1 Tax=Culicoides brevitarsis TaxID=469753 RepID=UPI00307B8803